MVPWHTTREGVGILGHRTIGDEDPIIRRIEHDADLVGVDSVFGEALAMRFVHGQHQVREPCAEPFLHLHDRNADRSEPSGKLVAIQLGHGVVHIEHQLGSRAAQRQRREDRRIRHGANDRDVIRTITRKLHRLACRGDEEIHIALQIRSSAGAPIARYFQPDNVYPVDEAGLSRGQRYRINLVATAGQCLGVPFDAAIMNIRGIGYD